MKPLYLSIDDKGQAKQEYDFSIKAPKAAMVCKRDIQEIRDYLTKAFYGTGESGKIELSYEYNGEEYTIKRNFDSNLAQLSYREGDLIYEGVDKVNEQINIHLKLTQKAFERLSVIDSGYIYENFIKTAKDRELFIGSLLDELVFDKAEVSLIANKIKEKYDYTQMKLKVLDEVSLKELDSLKKEMQQKQVIKKDIKAEQTALQENISKAQVTIETQKELKEEELLYEEAKGKASIIEKHYSTLKVSDEAEVIDKLIEQKQSILQRDKYIEQQAKELSKEIEKDTLAIEKGRASQQVAEQSLRDYLTRLQELRKIFYDKIQALANDEETQQSVIAQINEYYHKQNKELEVLYTKKEGIDNELLTLEQAYIDIYLRIKQVEKGADLKKAIREGAVLETEMKRLMDIIATSKVDVDNCQEKRKEISQRIEQKKKKLSKSKNIDEYDNIESKKQELTDAEKARRELFEYYILVSTHQKEIEDIEEKKQANLSKISQLKEDSLMLDGVKEALVKYISEQEKNKELLEIKLIELKAKQKATSKGSQDQKESQADDINFANAINRATDDLKKAKLVLEEYDDKLYYINKREGELSARIKVAEAYADSLQEDRTDKEVIIKGLLNKAGVQNIFELTQILDSAEDKYKELYKTSQDLELLHKGVEDWKEDTKFLQYEIDKIDNEQLPLLMDRYTSAQARLKECQSEYDILKQLIGSQSALDRFDEVTMSEKEYETLKSDLGDKRIKISDFLSQKEKVLELISLLEGKNRKVFFDGKEYDYPALNIKIIADSVSGETLKEIRKCEGKAEELKTELLAIAKVLDGYIERREQKTQDLHKLNARLESDKEVLDQIMTDFSGKMALLHIEDTKELRKSILSDNKREQLKKEIATHHGILALHEHRIDAFKSLIEKNAKHVETLEEYTKTLAKLNQRYEEIGFEVASIMAKREEMKSRAKQIFALKEKLNKYTDKLKVLGEISNLLKADGDITDYIIKLASKKIYSMTRGKYNLDTEDGELILFDNKKGGKSISKDAYSDEEKFLVSLILGVSLHRTLIDMIGGESLELLFSLGNKMISKTLAPGVARYVKNEKVIVLVDDEKMLDTFICTG